MKFKKFLSLLFALAIIIGQAIKPIPKPPITPSDNSPNGAPSAGVDCGDDFDDFKS